MVDDVIGSYDGLKAQQFGKACIGAQSLDIGRFVQKKQSRIQGITGLSKYNKWCKMAEISDKHKVKLKHMLYAGIFAHI